jgi:hypothetical protein
MDRYLQRLRPCRGCLACSLEHPSTNRNDQTGLFCNGNKRCRRLRCPAFGPAYQIFESEKSTIVETEEWLICQLECIRFQSAPQIYFESPAHVEDRVHSGFKEANGIATFGLSLVQSGVCARQQSHSAASVGPIATPMLAPQVSCKPPISYGSDNISINRSARELAPLG